jgi:uncharacterized protein YfdQ (DUF2303 family)
MSWYSKIVQDLNNIPDFITYYEDQIIQAKSDVRIHGNLEKNITALPGITELRFNQLQEIEAILNFLNIQLRKLKRKHYKKYLENYNRELSSKDAEKYADGEDEIIDFEILINEVSLIRNKFLGIMKALESKNFMLGHIARLRTAGMEDINL